MVDGSKKLLPCFRKVDCFHMIEKERRPNEAKLSLIKNSRHVRKGYQPPIVREIFVRQVIPVLRRKRLQPLFDCGVGAEIECTGVDDLSRKFHCPIELAQYAGGLGCQAGMKF